MPQPQFHHFHTSGKYRRAKVNFIKRYLGTALHHDPPVAGDGEHATTGDGVTVQGGNNGFGIEEDIRIETGELCEIADEGLFRVTQKFRNIETKGEELALTGKDDSLYCRIKRKFPKAISKLIYDRFIDGIDFAPA